MYDMARGATMTKLTQGRIAAAALALLERDGLDRFSMRRVAAELDVGAMTLYGYFRSKDELLDAAVDLASAEIALPPSGGTWQEQLRSLVTEMLRVLRAYPVAHHIRARGPMLSSGALRSTEAGLSILVGAGCSQEDASKAWRLLFTYVFGFAAFTPAELSDAERRELKLRLAGMDATELPHVAAAAAAGAEAMTGSDAFGFGLDAILAGLEARTSI